MMGGESETLSGLFGPSTGGLSVFENNPYRRSSQDVKLPSPSPPEKEGKKNKRSSSKVNVVDREVEGDAARKYRKLEQVANLDSNTTDGKEEVVPAPLHGQGKGVNRKRKKSGDGNSGRSGQDEEQLLDGEPGEKKKNKKKKKQQQQQQQQQAEKGGAVVSEGDKRKSGGAEPNGRNVESSRAVVKEEEEKRGAHAAEGTASVEKEKDIREGTANPGGDVEVASPGKRKRKEGDASDVKKKKPKLGAEEKAKRLLRTIFVGNLPTDVKKKALIREFSQFGPVESARLRSVPLVDSKLPRKAAVITGQLNEQRTSLNAYVVFESEEAAKAALAHNMKEFEGRHIRVDLAGGPSKEGEKSSVEYDKTRSIFVGNLPFDVEDEEVITLFSGSAGGESELEGVRVVRDRQTSIGKGFAFVLFKTKEAASRALFRRSFTLRDRKLRVYRLANTGQIEKQRQHHERKKDDRKRAREFNAGDDGRDEPSRKIGRGALSYEGVRASKADGKPGKWTGSNEKLVAGATKKSPKRAGGALAEPKAKRPAVAARKAAILNMKNGGGSLGSKPKPPVAGTKRKRDDRGGKKRKRDDRGGKAGRDKKRR